jgi:hypothetical protein
MVRNVVITDEDSSKPVRERPIENIQRNILWDDEKGKTHRATVEELCKAKENIDKIDKILHNV